MKIQFPFLSVREVALACDLSDANIYKHIELGHIDVIKRENFKNIMIPAASLGGIFASQSRGQVQASSQENTHGQGGEMINTKTFSPADLASLSGLTGPTILNHIRKKKLKAHRVRGYVIAAEVSGHS